MFHLERELDSAVSAAQSFAMANDTKVSVFDYLDYREFIRDYFAYLKENEGMTFRLFSRQAGFSSHTFLKRIIDGDRSVSIGSVYKIAKGFGLTDDEGAFFELLVRFNQAKETEEKNELYKRIVKLMPKTKVNKIRKNHFHVFSNWYIMAIRELVAHDDFKEDPEWIAGKLYPKISRKQAKEALEILLKVNYLVRNEDGKLEQASPSLTTGAEVQSLHIQNFHMSMMELARQNLSEMEDKWRDFSSLVFLTNREQFYYIKKRVIEFRKEILQYLNDNKSDEDTEFNLFNLTIQFFSSSKPKWKEKPKA